MICGFRWLVIAKVHIRFAPSRGTTPQHASVDRYTSARLNIIGHLKLALCSRNIQMTPLCQIEMTLPRFLGFRETRHDGGVDEQAGVQPAGRVVAGAVWPASG